MEMKKVYIIAGPNGAGKTTFASKFLPKYAKCPNFINADLIAKGLSPFNPQQMAIKAGKLVLQQIDELSHKGINFGFETTLSGKTHLRKFQYLKRKGYHIHLFFLWIPDEKLAIARIKNRVLEGGHNVPREDIKRRYGKSIKNLFKIYLPIVNSWMFFNNAGLTPSLLAKRNNGSVDIFNEELFQNILNKSKVKL